MIWLIGNKGMLGTELAQMLTAEELPFIGTDRDVDITNRTALENFAQKQADKGTHITFIINCAAYTNVNKAESDIELCTKLNAEGPENIAHTAHSIGAVVLHLSTDYVFNGKNTTPYTEDIPMNPTGVYGSTKAEGETALTKETDRYYILRTAWLYGKHGNNFVYTMLRLMNEKGSVTVVNDQFGTPTYAKDLAHAICSFAQAVETGKQKPFGIYHFTNLGSTNWFEFACKIRDVAQKCGKLTCTPTVSPCTTADYPTPAQRPAYSILSKDKIASQLDWIIPDWEKSLNDFIENDI